MNDPQEKNTQNPYHIYYDNYLDTNACTECTGLINHGIDSREQWDSFRQIFDFIPASETHDLTDKQDRPLSRVGGHK